MDCFRMSGTSICAGCLNGVLRYLSSLLPPLAWSTSPFEIQGWRLRLNCLQGLLQAHHVAQNALCTSSPSAAQFAAERGTEHTALTSDVGSNIVRSFLISFSFFSTFALFILGTPPFLRSSSYTTFKSLLMGHGRSNKLSVPLSCQISVSLFAATWEHLRIMPERNKPLGHFNINIFWQSLQKTKR